EEGAGFGRRAHAAENRGIGGDVALAAFGSDNHVGAVEQVGLAGNAGIAEREARRVDPDALPHLHLPLIALLRNLLVEIDRPERIHDVRRKALVVVRRRIAPREMAPVRLEPFAKAGHKSNAGDPHLAAFRHLANSLTATLIRSAQSNKTWRNCGVG